MRKIKDSGIEWIGEIPEDWNVRRLKNVLKERKESNKPIKTDFILSLTANDGVIPYSEKKSGGNKSKEDLSDYKLAYPGDIVVNNMNVISGSVGLSEYFGCLSPVYYTLYPISKLYNVKYFNYVFKSSVFQKSLRGLGNGIMMKESQNGKLNTVRMRISMDKLNTVLLPVPDSRTQELIADYLDSKVSEIDNIISKTKETIEEYKKYKQSVITEVVTKGLNPNVEMKDSGIEWIGNIPDHWKIRKGKYILELLSRTILENDEVITCFRDGEVTLRSNRREDGFTFADKEIGYQGVEPNDLVIHSMDGFAGAIGISDSRGKASPVVLVCDSYQNKEYIMYYLRSMAYNEVFTALATGIRVRSCDLRWNKIGNLLYPIPSIKEQEEIVTYIKDICIQIDKMISIKQELLLELEQYKKSLIYECVTGKKEVSPAYAN